jgi:uncharacterized protein (AIM24 family)
MPALDVAKQQTNHQSWRIQGTDSQIVEIILAPGESAICEPGSMCYTSNKVKASMTSVNAFGSALTGESIFKPKYTNSGDEVGFVGFTPNFPASILALDLKAHPEGFLVKDGMYFAQTGGGDAVRLNAKFSPAASTAACCCSGLDFIMQKLSPGPNPGFAFLAASGTILEKDLEPGEMIVVSTTNIVGFSDKVKVDVRSNGGCAVCCFAGEGMFSTVLTGPGKVMLQSMPIEKIRALFPKPVVIPKPTPKE